MCESHVSHFLFLTKIMIKNVITPIKLIDQSFNIEGEEFTYGVSIANQAEILMMHKCISS